MTSSDGEISVVVVDDHPALSRALTLLLPRYGFRVIGTASTASEALQMIDRRGPEAAVVDLDLGDESGIDLTGELRARDVDVPVIAFTGVGDPAKLRAALAAGARSVVLKTSSTEILAEAIRAVSAGEEFIDPSLAARLKEEDEKRQPILTKRQAEIMRLLADGLDIGEIADRLVLSEQTVQTHIRDAIKRLGARGRTHAIALALREGELDQVEEGG